MRLILGIVALVALLTSVFVAPMLTAAAEQKTHLAVIYTDVVPGPMNRAYAVRLINEERAKMGVPPVVEDPLLDQSAQNKVNDMAEKDYFTHDQFWRWVNATGAKWTWLGENLAAVNPVSKDNLFFNIVPFLHQSLVNSPGHHAIMTSPQAKKVGVGLHFRDVDDKVFYVEHYSD